MRNGLKNQAWRNDAVAKVTGNAKYTDDIKFENTLHAVPVYTDYVHAKINTVDFIDAEKSEGVVKIITAKDVPGKLSYGQIFEDYDMLAKNKIRFNGDVIAIVVANTKEEAINASKKIKIDVTQLPLILDPEKAMQDKKNLVHEAKGTNIINHHKIRRGKIDAAFKKADFIIEQEFSTPFVEHAYLEPESALAIPRSDGTIEVYTSVQHPFSARRFTAALLGKKLADIEVITPAMGGGFGGKDDTASIVCARTSLAAMLTGQPVKMTYEREWSMRESYKRHPYKSKYSIAINKLGKILGVKCHIIADGGAYASVTPWVTWRSTVQCCGPYIVPNVHGDVYGVYTNNNFTGAMRGFGSPQVNFMIEQLIEMAAEKIGMDPIKFRKLNMLKQNSKTITEQKLDSHKVSLAEVMTKVMKEIDYKNKIKKASFGKSNHDELYGIGLALSYRGMSLGAEGVDFCSAIINVQSDGSVLLEVGIHENGQGAQSAMVLLLAESLGIKKELIRYKLPSTSNIPDGGPTVASRATLMGGGAVVNASKILKDQIATVISKKLKCKKSEIVFKNNFIVGKKNARISWKSAIHEMFVNQTYPYAFGVFQAPKVSWNKSQGKGKAYFTWVYGCQAVELSINKKTGKIKIVNVVAAHDVGKAVNPAMLLGQYYGGITQGIGYALSEKVEFKNGIIQNLNLNNYRIPRANEVPDMYGIIVENADPNSPSKAKGVGEPALEITAAAIANAYYHATGKRCFDLPIGL